MSKQERKVKTILDEFQDHVKTDENRHIHVTEWINGEGVDVTFKDGEKVSLSWSQYIKLREIINNDFLWSK